MMEAKHTPGPWKIWEHGTETDPSCKIFAEKYDKYPEMDKGTFWHIGIAQTMGGNDEANARLIATAPDLLEALKAWQKYDSEMGDIHPCPDYTLRIHYRNTARKLTQAALAKLE